MPGQAMAPRSMKPSGPGRWIVPLLAWVVACLAAPTPAAAQVGGPAPPAAPAPRARSRATERGERRLFQRFVEDAAIIPGGWLEAQYRYDNFDNGSVHRVGPLVAFKLVDNIEAGLRFGFIDSRPDAGSSESGISDIDLYAKYRLPGARSRFAVGTLVKTPTADDTRGLGTGKTDLELFGAFRADLEAVTLTANAGVRFNGNPAPPLPSIEDTVFVGAAVLLPASPQLTFVIEGTYESRTIKGTGADGRLTLGLQSFGPERRGGFRGAVALPLSDGAPNYQVLLGAFLVY
ncbi:MAG TPA: hypothetical protein VFT43_07805 [Candidatus Polarisedimenticolia bacterium]|nr:hypothetical protein [Candidatus Polarisedimenticolia bacterium]